MKLGKGEEGIGRRTATTRERKRRRKVS